MGETVEKNIKKRIFEIIQIGNRNDTVSLAADILIVLNIFLNIICMFLETFDEMAPYFTLITTVENITIWFFCVEYALRIWTAEYLYPNETKAQARLHFLRSFDGVIDLLTILPFFFLTGFVVFRMLRVVRIFHLFRINSRYDSFNVITSVISEKRNQIASSVLIILILMFASSLCIYSAEHDVQPEAFKNAFSGVWWAMSTLLTVGYGDIYPITPLGQTMAIIIAFLGVGVVAIPTGIISAGFVEQYTKLKNAAEITSRRNIRFLTFNVTEEDGIAGMRIKEARLPKELVVLSVVRDTVPLQVDGNTTLQVHDKVILAGHNYADDADIRLTEVLITPEHNWANRAVRDLNISRHTTLVSIDRDGFTIIPRGSTVLLPGDVVVVYARGEFKQ